MANIEHEIQAACVEWFRWQHRDLSAVLFAVPNGSRRSRWQAQQAKEEGMVAGVADLILLTPRGGYGALCVEMKKEEEVWKKGERTMKRGYQSREQREWQAAAEKAGNRYVVCRSREEFEREVEAYLSLTETARTPL